MKPREFPPELRDFARMFQELTYRHNPGKVFSDFVSYLIHQFAPAENPGELVRLLEIYSDKEKAMFPSLMRVLLDALKTQFDSGQRWYDALGTIYEIFNSRSKVEKMGQVFTPPEICDMMAQLNPPEPKADGSRVMVADEACGSGRNLLAYNSYYPGAYITGADIDQICVKMTAFNMMLHGITGRVIWKDTLRNEVWGGYEVNPYLYKTGLPCLVPLVVKKEQEQKNEPEPAEIATETPAPPPEEKPFSLF